MGPSGLEQGLHKKGRPQSSHAPRPREGTVWCAPLAPGTRAASLGLRKTRLCPDDGTLSEWPALSPGSGAKPAHVLSSALCRRGRQPLRVLSGALPALRAARGICSAQSDPGCSELCSLHAGSEISSHPSDISLTS